MKKTLNKPLLIEQIKTMLHMQDDVNKHLIGDNWREKKHPFYRAIWTESAELMDHIGWKWWKLFRKPQLWTAVPWRPAGRCCNR